MSAWHLGEKPEIPESEDLYWHALNFRTAAPQHAEAMWQELRACVGRKVAAACEECAKLCDAEAEKWEGAGERLCAAMIRSYIVKMAKTG